MKAMKKARIRAIGAIELMVLVALIGLVVGFIYPAFQKARHASLMTENIARLRQIGLAYLAYAGDHSGATPIAKRHSTLSKGPWFGTANTWGAPARQLFSESNPRWGVNGEGKADYLQSPDPLYSPFYVPTAQRKKGTFQAGSYGYYFMYSPFNEPLTAGFYNDHVRYGASMPICSDVFGAPYVSGSVNSDRCAVLYLDGGVVTYPQSELIPSRRGYDARFQYLLKR